MGHLFKFDMAGNLIADLKLGDGTIYHPGGLDYDGRNIWVPVLLWTAGGMDMTHNPVWLEPSEAGLRGYFMPEDDKSTLYIYDVEAK